MFSIAICSNFYISIVANGRSMLSYLVTFWQIGIKIIFTGKVIKALNIAMAVKPHSDSMFNGLMVHLEQSARMSKCDRTYMRIRLAAKTA